MPGSDWKPSNWLNEGLIPIAAVSMRVAWLYPLIRLMLRNPFVYPQNIEYPVWLVFGILLGSSLIVSLIEDPRPRALATVGGGLLVVLLTLVVLFGMNVTRPHVWFMQLVTMLTNFRLGVPAPFVAFAATAVLWQRGLLARWADYHDLWRGFISGIIMLGLLLLLREQVVIDTVGFDMVGPVLAFSLSSLMALALVGLAQALTLDSTTAMERPSLNRYWLVAVGSVVLVILGLGYGLGQSFAPESLTAFIRLLHPVGQFIVRILMYILLALAYVFFWLLNPLIEFLRGRIQEALEQPPPEFETGAVEEFLEEQALRLQLSPQAITILQIVLVVVLLAALVIAFLYVRSRQRRHSPRLMTEERDFIWSADLMRGQLRDLLRRRRPQRLAPYLHLGSSEDPREAVRRIYQQLLLRARDAHMPRPPAVTPLAFQRVLENVLPDEAPALDALTHAYLWARYTEDAPPEGVVETARAAWERIREAWPPEPDKEPEIPPDDLWG
jgi:hypothetical protein